MRWHLWIDFGLLPAIGALHGWITNLIAIRLLFRPRRPFGVGRFRVQGALPRRHAELAESIGRAVERELFSAQDLVAALGKENLVDRLLEALDQHAHQRLQEILPHILPTALRARLVAYLTEALHNEAEPAIAELLGHAEQALRQEGHIAERVRARLLEFNLEELERMVVRVAGQELRMIEGLGFFMGLSIGLMQGLVLYLIGY